MKEWLSDNGFVDIPTNDLDISTLKMALLQLLKRLDIHAKLRDSIRAIAYGLDVVAAKKVEKVVMEAVKRVMEGYKDALGMLAEVLVKTVKEMAEQAKERMDRAKMEEG
ncbi:hypothetical protein C0989_003363 [Termitomyces sp. Mn162]|nr:hypothetical protein C0989_003363 [Termitomyces sp. Mn162]